MLFLPKLIVSLYPGVTATPKLQQVCFLKVAYIKEKNIVLQYHYLCTNFFFKSTGEDPHLTVHQI
jgi:hypothetical protein